MFGAFASKVNHDEGTKTPGRKERIIDMHIKDIVRVTREILRPGKYRAEPPSLPSPKVGAKPQQCQRIEKRESERKR